MNLQGMLSGGDAPQGQYVYNQYLRMEDENQPEQTEGTSAQNQDTETQILGRKHRFWARKHIFWVRKFSKPRRTQNKSLIEQREKETV